MKKKVKSLFKDSMVIAGTGIVAGVGAGVVADAGGDTTAMSNLGKGLGHVASVRVAGTTLGLVNDLAKQNKIKKRGL